MNNDDKRNNNLLRKYAGMTFQFLSGIGLFLYIGFKLDGWLNFSVPIFIWLLPLIFITGTIIKLIIETNKSNKSKNV